MLTGNQNAGKLTRPRSSEVNKITGRHEWTRTSDLYRVKIAFWQPAIDSKGVNNRRNRQNRNTRRNLLPNCYQNMNMASGFGGRIVGDRPLCFALKQLDPCL